MDVQKSKQQLRKDLLTRRNQLDVETIFSSSKKMCQCLCQWEYYTQAKTVMLFLPMTHEPQLLEVFENAWTMDKKVCVPHLRQTYGLMDAARINNFDRLITGKLGLSVPDPQYLEVIAPEKIDLIVVPAVAFDVSGNRLGMGAGYYDRFLPQALHATCIGVCWQSHVLNYLPTAPHDQAVQYLLTETGIIDCSH